MRDEFDGLFAMKAPTKAPVPAEITGKVIRLYRATPAWSAGKMLVKSREVPFTVKAQVTENQPLTLRGEWEQSKYGRQFVATEIVYTIAADAEGVRLWLEYYANDIGPAKARRLTDKYGATLPDLMATDPDKVAAFAGIPVESVKRAAALWGSYCEQMACIAELIRLGLTPAQAEKVYTRFKGGSVAVVKFDPYALLRVVEGFGWKTVDAMAAKLGLAGANPNRWRAAIVAAVADAEDEGSTAVSEADAVGAACDLCDLPAGDYAAKFRERVEEAVAAKTLKRLPTGAGFALALPAACAHESLVWTKLAAGASANPHVPADDADKLAALYGEITAKGVTLTLDDTQRAAVALAARSRVCFITGGAGSGKTTVIRCIEKMFRDSGLDVRLAAPTGKAARRMQDVTGREATTIHRLLGYSPHGAASAGGEYSAGGWAFDDRNQLTGGVVILDEASMLDAELAYRALRACGTNVSLVFVGDPNQLPAVGAGAILRDVIDHGIAPVAKLGVCHRHAGALKRNCNAILEGRVEPTVRTETGAYPWYVKDDLRTPERVLEGVRLLFTKYLGEWGYKPSSDVQFLTAQHKGPLGTMFLNRYCQWMRQAALGETMPEPKPDDAAKAPLMIGDKVMQTKNDYDLNVMNGEQGVVTAKSPELTVRYDDKTVAYPPGKASAVHLAYCITPHKAQGSEWPCAVVICPKSHSFMQTRAWLYTGATRAKSTCIILGDEDGIKRAVAKTDGDKRATLLGVFAVFPEARPK